VINTASEIKGLYRCSFASRDFHAAQSATSLQRDQSIRLNGLSLTQSLCEFVT